VNLDEARVPPVASFKVKCSKCAQIFVAGREAAAPAPQTDTSVPAKQIHTSADWERLKPAVEAMLKAQLESVKQEILAAVPAAQMSSAESQTQAASTERPLEELANKRALVCEEDRATSDAIVGVLGRLGYTAEVCINAIEALRKLDGRYQLIVTNSAFADDPQGGQKILSKINSEKQDFRRLVFVVLVGSTLKTADASNGFFHGANIVVNKDDLKNIERLILEGQREFQTLYQPYYELLENTTDRL
jgi:CheY-like chemotaxis protein